MKQNASTCICWLTSGLREASGDTEHHVPPVITRMLDDFPDNYLCYVLNLHWDVLAYNEKADRYLHFSEAQPGMCNFLYLLFTDPHYQTRFTDWGTDAQRLLASFRRDYARTKHDPNIQRMITALCQESAALTRCGINTKYISPVTASVKLNITADGKPTEYAS